MKVFHHHFMRNPGPKSYKSGYENIVKLDSAVSWEHRQKISWTFNRDTVSFLFESLIHERARETYFICTNILIHF